MSQRNVVLALCGLVLLLLGVIAGQNLERSRAGPGQPRTPAQDAAVAGVANAPAEPQAPLSSTEYWISTREMDATRIGYSSWAVLRPGGNFILERCRAPDYALPEKRDAPLPPPVPQCESVANGSISQLGDGRLTVRDGDGSERTFWFSLRSGGKTPALVLDAGERVELVPGSKNSLFDRLGALPGDENARTRYLRQMFANGVASAPARPSSANPAP